MDYFTETKKVVDFMHSCILANIPLFPKVLMKCWSAILLTSFQSLFWLVKWAILIYNLRVVIVKPPFSPEFPEWRPKPGLVLFVCSPAKGRDRLWLRLLKLSTIFHVSIFETWKAKVSFHGAMTSVTRPNITNNTWPIKPLSKQDFERSELKGKAILIYLFDVCGN